MLWGHLTSKCICIDAKLSSSFSRIMHAFTVLAENFVINFFYLCSAWLVKAESSMQYLPKQRCVRSSWLKKKIYILHYLQCRQKSISVYTKTRGEVKEWIELDGIKLLDGRGITWACRFLTHSWSNLPSRLHMLDHAFVDSTLQDRECAFACQDLFAFVWNKNMHCRHSQRYKLLNTISPHTWRDELIESIVHKVLTLILTHAGINAWRQLRVARCGGAPRLEDERSFRIAMATTAELLSCLTHNDCASSFSPPATFQIGDAVFCVAATKISSCNLGTPVSTWIARHDHVCAFQHE